MIQRELGGEPHSPRHGQGGDGDGHNDAGPAASDTGEQHAETDRREEHRAAQDQVHHRQLLHAVAGEEQGLDAALTDHQAGGDEE